MLEVAVFEDGRTKGEIARLCDLSPSHFSQILSGHRNPRIDTAIRICKVLDRGADEIFRGDS